MRPRVFPAEDSATSGSPSANRRRFNEAAGIPRGRLRLSRAVGERLLVASMRPRVFPAEDNPPTRPRRPPAQGFNEAAGIPRGRRRQGRPASEARRCRFNEAAGIPRGRPRLARGRHAGRPRFNEAAGIPSGRHPGIAICGIPPNDASMRPRVFPAEDADPLVSHSFRSTRVPVAGGRGLAARVW